MATPRILALTASPRQRSNTGLLIDRMVAGARSQGAHSEIVDLCRARIGPCIACDGCYTQQRCVVEDDFQAVFDELVLADHIVLATPIYFMGVSAQAKQFIDRCQCLWALKYIHKLPLPPPHGSGPRRGHLISVGGSGGATLFQCARRTFEYFLDALDAEMGTSLLYKEIDERAEILRHPTALSDAFGLGLEIGLPSPQTPTQLP